VEAMLKEMQNFTQTMRSEYLDFFKNRGRIRSEISNIAKDIDQRIETNKIEIEM
jgi:hypothetical protein